mmetsp:Transcript_22631/g.63575  ORF Transcript_22631/g.63575 Transcript_22631/m.63575 type:complete len:210 (-) Transcript_22631:642-1271(-)
MRESAAHVGHQRIDLHESRSPARLERVVQGPPRHQLFDEADVGGFQRCAVQLHHARVLDARQDGHFPLEAVTVAFEFGESEVEDLDGDLLAAPGASEHRPEGPPPDGRAELQVCHFEVPTDFLEGRALGHVDGHTGAVQRRVERPRGKRRPITVLPPGFRAFPSAPGARRRGGLAPLRSVHPPPAIPVPQKEAPRQEREEQNGERDGHR